MTARSVLSVGEAMVELSPAGQDDAWRLGIAGDTLNTAWYLRRLTDADCTVDYLTRVGQGEFSQKMVDFLTHEGIGTHDVSRHPDREIGLYTISLKDGERSFSYWRDTSAARTLADDPAALNAAMSGRDIVYLSGITVAILPPDGRATLRAALARARAAGTLVVFDPNLRPRLWDNLDEMRTGIEDVAAEANLVLPSFDDEAQHFGDADPGVTIRRYLDLGADAVTVKNGGGPIEYAGPTGEGRLEFTPEPAVDTTAAGDSFNAGYLAALIRGADAPSSIIAGHALSRQVIRHRGALVAQAVTDAQADLARHGLA